MSKSIEDSIAAYSLVPTIETYDLVATFGENQPGRSKKLLVSKGGKVHLDTGDWEAGDIAYQYLSQLHHATITPDAFRQLALDSLSMANEFYAALQTRADEGSLVMMMNGVECGAKGLAEAWDGYDWCDRVLMLVDTTESFAQQSDEPFPDEVRQLYDEMIALVLLQRLDDAVIAQFMDGHGLTELVLEVASLRDRLKPPIHVLRAINSATKSAVKEVMAEAVVAARSDLAKTAAQARHSKSRFHKQMVFDWCDQNMDRFSSMDDAALDIAETFVPEKFRAVRDWMTEWRKLRSAGRL